MSILFPTTTIQMMQPGEDDWGGAPDPSTYTPVGSPVRAHLSSPSGQAAAAQNGSTSTVTYRLLCDPCDLKPDMQVKDLGSGVVYQVDWCQPKPGPMPHTVAGLTYVTATT
jgi:hypothetical protein